MSPLFTDSDWSFQFNFDDWSMISESYAGVFEHGESKFHIISWWLPISEIDWNRYLLPTSVGFVIDIDVPAILDSFNMNKFPWFPDVWSFAASIYWMDQMRIPSYDVWTGLYQRDCISETGMVEFSDQRLEVLVRTKWRRVEKGKLFSAKFTTQVIIPIIAS